MRLGSHPRLRKFALSAAIALASTLVAYAALGPRIALVTGCIGFLAVAYASDDDLGSCMIWALMLLVALLVVLMALAGAVMVGRGG